MRKVIDLQLYLIGPEISEIEFDLESRDEIPKLLLGLQSIYSNKEIFQKVIKVLRQIVPKKVNAKKGRPGMDLWKILVLGTLRLNCNWDFDKVHEIANNHRLVRLMLQHDEGDWRLYKLQTIKDNVQLLTPEILDKINQIVVQFGHELMLKNSTVSLKGNCDSFVVETNVHYPTDTNLLYDAIRKMIQTITGICAQTGITEWRQYNHNIMKLKKILRRLERLWHTKPKKDAAKAKKSIQIVDLTNEYLNLCQSYINKTKITVFTHQKLGLLSLLQSLKILQINEYIKHAERQIDQVERRVLLGEKIPHSEKVFSIFEPHTEFIKKGKAGVPQEMGLRVCVMKDQLGFILHHKVMEKLTDDKIAVTFVEETINRFPQFNSCSFDKGFYTPQNKINLNKILDESILPKKGKLSAKEKEIEYSENFVAGRKKHAGVESSINALENHGLDKCSDHGLHGFKRYVGLAVLARNLQIIGDFKQQKQLGALKKAA